MAGTRVEMVSSPESLVEQLPSDLLTDDQVEENAFFTRFWAQHDRIRVWLDDTDPPGERSADVARRFFTFARSLADVSSERPRHYVCVTHSGPLRTTPRVPVSAVRHWGGPASCGCSSSAPTPGLRADIERLEREQKDDSGARALVSQLGGPRACRDRRSVGGRS